MKMGSFISGVPAPCSFSLQPAREYWQKSVFHFRIVEFGCYTIQKISKQISGLRKIIYRTASDTVLIPTNTTEPINLLIDMMDPYSIVTDLFSTQALTPSTATSGSFLCRSR
jgi:hypothetical protein